MNSEPILNLFRSSKAGAVNLFLMALSVGSLPAFIPGGGLPMKISLATLPYAAQLWAGCRGGPAPDSWPKGSEEERFHKVEVQLRGLDVAMMEVGNRFTELTFAGRDRNRPYARYKAERIGLVIRLGIEGRSKRAASALAETLPDSTLELPERRGSPIRWTR